jgi:hypothetical protein
MALKSGQTIGVRNPLYRRRVVKIQVYTEAGQTPPADSIPTIILTEVDSVRIASSGATGIMNGPVSPVIQPWYFQPFTIELSGKSYMGAFSSDALNVAVDDDVPLIMQLRDFVNQKFLFSNSTVTDLLFLLFIGDPLRSAEGTDDYYVGLFDDISIDESEDAPFVQKYSLKFTGESLRNYELNKGVNNAQKDIQETSQATGTSVAEKTPPQPPATAQATAKATGSTESAGRTTTGTEANPNAGMTEEQLRWQRQRETAEKLGIATIERLR